VLGCNWPCLIASITRINELNTSAHWFNDHEGKAYFQMACRFAFIPPQCMDKTVSHISSLLVKLVQIMMTPDCQVNFSLMLTEVQLHKFVTWALDRVNG
jgi:hypothetical protein